MANPKIEVEIGGKIKDLEQKLNQANGQLQNTGKEFGKLNQFAVGALQGIAAAFTVSAVVNFGRAVLDTTAKFQKFEAVLSNTLGSESAAALALQTITDFASQTPFAVDELTSSFVKLANQGFKPTINELRSLGDLASSTGKSFDQLAEAIIDAQVGEFERLKEFGIRAKKEGDNVTFTFKGVETQVKATDDAIRDYVLSLGNAVGVSGAMEKISGTLGGKLSNLGDNIESLKLAIGDQTSGVFATSIDWLNEFVRLATIASKSVAQIRDEASQGKIGAVIAANREEVLKLAEAYQKANPDLTEQAALAKSISDVSRGYREAKEDLEAFRRQDYTQGELKNIIEGFTQMSIELLNVGGSAKLTFEEFEKLSDIANKKVFAKWESEAFEFNRELESSIKFTDKLQKAFDSLSNINPLKTTESKKVDGQEQGFQLSPEVLMSRLSAIEMPAIDTSAFEESVSIADQKIIEANSLFVTRMTELSASVSGILNDAIAGSLTNFGAALGQSLADGAGFVKSAGKALLSGLATILGQLGELAIGTGIAILGIQIALKSLNPYAAIAAGVALVALSALVGAKLGGMGSAVSGGGGGVGAGSGRAFTGSGSNSFDPFKQFKVEVVGTISGEDIGFSLARSEERDN